MLLAAAAVVTTNSRDRADRSPIPLDAHSVEPEGAFALYLWTQRLGRETDYLEYEPFKLDRDDALLVSLQPLDRYEPEELRELVGWLRDGGSLLLATDTSGSGLLAQLGVTLRPGAAYSSASPAQPLLRRPPVEAVSAAGGPTLEFEEGVPLLRAGAADGGPVLVAHEVGRGRVWVWSTPKALSNQQLGKADNWKVYLNLLSDVRGGRVRFDEYHHGKPDVVGLRALLVRERWGWAFWYTGAVLLGYLLLRGKRLGRPVTTGKTRYRSSGEYVRSLASLLRAGKKSEYLSSHYADSLSRSLQQAAALPPTTPLGELRRVAEEKTGAPAGKVEQAIQALRAGSVREPKQMLGLVAEAERERKNLRRRRAW
jgi:hypothetical protein